MDDIEIIGKWPSLTAFAADIGVSYGTAKAMRRRKSIPSEYWRRLINCAAERTIDGVTLEQLAENAAKRRKAAPAEAVEAAE